MSQVTGLSNAVVCLNCLSLFVNPVTIFGCATLVNSKQFDWSECPNCVGKRLLFGTDDGCFFFVQLKVEPASTQITFPLPTPKQEAFRCRLFQATANGRKSFPSAFTTAC